MSPTEKIHEGIESLRDDIDQLRGALDSTDAVMSIADDAVQRAHEVVESSRRALPFLIAAGVVTVAAVVGIVAWRRRRHASPE